MLILERPWTRQPHGAVGVDWGNPITQGLVFAFDGQESDAVQRRVVDITNNAGRGVGEKGKHRTYGGNPVDTQISFKAINPPTQYATVLSLAYCTSSTATSSLCALPSETTSNVRVLMDISGTESNDPVRVILQNGASIGIAYLAQPSGEYLNKWVLFGGGVVSGTDNRIYINGVRKTPSSTAGTSGIAFGAITRFDVGVVNSGSPQNGFVGNIALSACWDRLLTDAEHASLYINPWQLFAPQQIIIPTPAAAVVPTLSASTYVPGSMTSTGWRPQITAS